jgi:hypothetical protein
MDDTPPHKDRNGTPEELRRSPNRNKKMKMDNLGNNNVKDPEAYLVRRLIKV